MSIDAMKQALEALRNAEVVYMEQLNAMYALQQVIAEAEMVEKGTKAWADTPNDWVDDLRGGAEPVGYVSESGKGAYLLAGVVLEDDTPLYAAPVYASDISQEPVDETAKREHEPVAWIVDGEIKVRLDMAGKLYYSETNVYGKDVVNKAIEQEPVAFRNIETGEFCTGGFLRKDWAKWQPLYAAPVHASDISQKPVDETAKDQLVPDGTIPISNGGIATSTPTDFFAPPKREWVGLTDDEIKDIREDLTYDDEDFNELEFARDIEAKLKEKNR